MALISWFILYSVAFVMVLFWIIISNYQNRWMTNDEMPQVSTFILGKTKLGQKIMKITIFDQHC